MDGTGDLTRGPLDFTEGPPKAATLIAASGVWVGAASGRIVVLVSRQSGGCICVSANTPIITRTRARCDARRMGDMVFRSKSEMPV